MPEITNILDPWIANQYLQALTFLVGFFVISKLVIWISEKILLRIAKKTKTDIDDQIIERTNRPISLLLILGGARLAIEALHLAEVTEQTIVRTISSFAVIVVTYTVIVIFDILIDGWGKKWAEKTSSKIDDELIKILHRFSKALFAILGLLFILSIWGIEIGPLLASLGIAGIAVAFALQNTLGNIFGGISMIVDKTIKVGDVVEIDQQTKGTVIDVGLRSTRIRTFDNEVIIMPNGKLADSKIQNYVPPDPSVRVVIPFSVAYGSKIDKVKKIAMKEIKTVEGFMKEPEPFVRFLEMADSSLKFKAYFYVDNYTKRFSAIDEANTKIYNALNKAKITIPFPQMDVHLKKK